MPVQVRSIRAGLTPRGVPLPPRLVTQATNVVRRSMMMDHAVSNGNWALVKSTPVQYPAAFCRFTSVRATPSVGAPLLTSAPYQSRSTTPGVVECRKVIGESTPPGLCSSIDLVKENRPYVYNFGAVVESPTLPKLSRMNVSGFTQRESGRPMPSI